MPGWRCFLVEPSPYGRRSLRRFTYSVPGVVHCHDATIVAEPIVEIPPSEFLGRQMGNGEFEGDQRWPARCSCGYVFGPDDPRQALEERLFWGFPDGRLWALRDPGFPVGAMWEASWLAEHGDVGPDGKSYVVQMPGGSEFRMDGPASNDPKGWTRTGIPPFITVRPSIHQEGRYHGYIDGGVIGETVDGYVCPEPRTGDDPEMLCLAKMGPAAVAKERNMGTALIEEISPGIVQANAEGAVHAYRTPEVWKRFRLGGIVNVAWDIPQEYPDVPSLRLHLNDDLPVAHEDFDRAVEFQKRLSAENKCTLVHCRAGVNRSSIVIAAMMVGWGTKVEDALARLPRKPYTQVMYDSLWSWARARGR